MPTPTYDLITSTTLAAPTTLVTFTSLAQTYRDLVFIIQVPPTTTTIGDVLVRPNSDGGTNYSWIEANANGSTYASGVNTTRTGLYAGYHPGSNAEFITKLNLMDYSATDKHKTTLARNDTNLYMAMIAGRWANTAAINRLDIIGSNGNFPTGTTMNLYGVIS